MFCHDCSQLPTKSDGKRSCFTEEGEVTDEKDLRFTENIVCASNAYCYSEERPRIKEAKGHFKSAECEVALVNCVDVSSLKCCLLDSNDMARGKAEKQSQVLRSTLAVDVQRV